MRGIKIGMRKEKETFAWKKNEKTWTKEKAVGRFE